MVIMNIPKPKPLTRWMKLATKLEAKMTIMKTGKSIWQNHYYLSFIQRPSGPACFRYRKS